MANGFIGQVHIGGDDYLLGSTLFGICDTKDVSVSGGSNTKQVVLQSGVLFKETTGITIHVKFTYANTETSSSNLKLQVLSSGSNTYTTARSIQNYNGPITWNADSIISFTFDGTSYVINSSAIDGSSIQNLSLGNITNNGTLQATDVTITNGDKLVITDASDNNKIARASLAFGDAIATPSQSDTFLRSDGTWATPVFTTNYEATLITAASSGATSTAAGGTNEFYLNLIENSTVRSSHKVIGTGSVTVASSANGDITITGTKSGTVTSITPGNGLITGTSGSNQTAITESGTISIATGGVTNDMLAGSIANTKLANYTITIGSTTKELGQTFTLADLGLSSALRFIGITTTEMSDGRTTAAIRLTGASSDTIPNAGDVVIDSNSDAEYVWTGSIWERLGRDSSWALDSDVIKKALFTQAYQIVYSTSANNPTVLNANTTSTKKFLSMTGTGSAGQAPVWATVEKSDIGLDNVENTALSTWPGSANIVTVGTISTGTWQGTPIAASYIGSHNHSASDINDGVLAIARGGTNISTYAKGDILYASAANTLSKLTATTDGYVLTLDGGVPAWKANQATDENVKQSPIAQNGTGATSEYAVLFKNTAATWTEETAGVKFTSTESYRVTINPSTGAITAKKFIGDGSSLTNISWSNLTNIPETHLYVNATAAGASSNAATANTTTYMHLYDGTNKRDTIQFTGAGGASVSATNGKVITITSKEYTASTTTVLNALTLKYNDGTAHTETPSTDKYVAEVNGGILYIKSIVYGTDATVNTGFSEVT